LAAILVENLTYYYPKSTRPALKNITLKIERGDFIIITGPSGSGKSTLVRTFNGLIPHFYEGRFEGRVLVFGVDTRRASVAELSRKVGIVFQDPENQILTLSVEREIAFGLENLGLPSTKIRERVNEVLKELKIEDLRYRVPFELSIGEQQKVIVASILAMKPKVLVFDEPTAHMDPYSAWIFSKILKELNRKGYTIVVVEHRLDLLVEYATKIFVLKDGKLYAQGKPDEILERDDIDSIGVNVPKFISFFKKLKNHVRTVKVPRSIKEASEVLRKVVMWSSL